MNEKDYERRLLIRRLFGLQGDDSLITPGEWELHPEAWSRRALIDKLEWLEKREAHVGKG